MITESKHVFKARKPGRLSKFWWKCLVNIRWLHKNSSAHTGEGNSQTGSFHAFTSFLDMLIPSFLRWKMIDPISCVRFFPEKKRDQMRSRKGCMYIYILYIYREKKINNLENHENIISEQLSSRTLFCIWLFSLDTPYLTRYTPDSRLQTLYSTFYTLHSTFESLHCTHGTLHSDSRFRTWVPHSTLHSTLQTLHSTLHTSHLTLHIQHSTLRTAHSTLFTPDFTLATPHSTLYTSVCSVRSTLHTLDFTL